MSDTRPLGPHFKIAVTRPLGKDPTPPGAADPSEITEILIFRAHPREPDPITLQLEVGMATSELVTEPGPAVGPHPASAGLTAPGAHAGPLAGLWRRIWPNRAMPGSR